MATMIRRALPADADEIARFNTLLAQETEGRALVWDTIRAGVARVLAEPALGQYWLAERNGRPVGQMLITYEWSDWRNGLFWWIQSVYVRHEARGGGVYAALHQFVADAARRAGVCGLRLYVERENTGAQTAYARLGMQRTSYELFETDWSGAAAPE